MALSEQPWKDFKTTPTPRTNTEQTTYRETLSPSYCGECEDFTHRNYAHSRFHPWKRGLTFQERHGTAPLPSREELDSRISFSFWDYFKCQRCSVLSGEGPCDQNTHSEEDLAKRKWLPTSEEMF